MAKWQVQYVKVLVPGEQWQHLLRAAQLGLKDVLLAPEPRLDFHPRSATGPTAGHLQTATIRNNEEDFKQSDVPIVNPFESA